MKRCPECGFRANDHTCPLCGVRMRALPDAAQDLRTHVHRQTGENCVLPNQERQKRFSPPTPSARKQKKQEKKPNTQVLQIIAAVIIFLLFRACAS